MRLSTAVVVCLSAGAPLGAEQVAVRHAEGVLHGLLVLRTLSGDAIASGDLIQVARGSRVTVQLVFHFTDGSLHEETTVFSQDGRFRLLTDRLVQNGPAFPHPLEMTIDAGSGRVAVRYTDDDGQEQRVTKQLEIPPDLSNGLIPVLLKNVDSKRPPESFSFLAAMPEPRLVRLKIGTAAVEPFSAGGASREAMHYVLKVDLGGITGLVAPLVGKQPPDSHVWILEGEAPALVKTEQPLYPGGPVWRIELASPVWPESSKRPSP